LLSLNTSRPGKLALPHDVLDLGSQVTLHLGRTKPRSAEEDQIAVLSGSPVAWLQDWLSATSIMDGPVFRKIDKWGNISDGPLSSEAINTILKARLEKIGRDPDDYSAHGLRSGFITDALSKGIPLAEVMAQTGHQSVKQAVSYFQADEQRRSRASRLIE